MKDVCVAVARRDLEQLDEPGVVARLQALIVDPRRSWLPRVRRALELLDAR